MIEGMRNSILLSGHSVCNLHVHSFFKVSFVFTLIFVMLPFCGG